MEYFEEKLKDIIVEELYELSWRLHYPIHPAIGLLGFFESFRNQGISVINNDKIKKATFGILTTNDKFKMLKSELSYDEILEGWKRCPKCSPNSLYDSIYIVYNKMGELLDNRDHELFNKWSNLRNRQSRNVREKMDEIILPYFLKYHENMLLPVSGKIPELKEPKLFKKVIDDFPMTLLNNAKLYDFHNNVGCGPCAEYIHQMNFSDFDENYHPSENSVIAYFLGKYLYALSEEKGYSIKNKENKLESLVRRGAEAFKNGENFSWNFK